MLRTAVKSIASYEPCGSSSSHLLLQQSKFRTGLSHPELRRPARRRNFGSSSRRANASSASEQASPASRRSTSRLALAAAGLGLFGSAAYFLGAIYPPERIELVFARPAPPPALPGSADAISQAERIEQQLAKLPHIKSLLASASAVEAPPPTKAPQAGDLNTTPGMENPATTATAEHVESQVGSEPHYVMSRPYAKLPPQMMPHSLTAGALRKPGMLAVPPLVVSKTKRGAKALGGHQGDAYAFVHLGRSLCGHDGIVHGGLLATILDETLARTAFYNLPANIGVTARLEVDYKWPVKADQIVVVETRLKEAIGRKAYVEGEIRDLSGRLLVQSQALFVQPRHVEWLNTDAVRHVMDRQGGD